MTYNSVSFVFFPCRDWKPLTSGFQSLSCLIPILTGFIPLSHKKKDNSGNECVD